MNRLGEKKMKTMKKLVLFCAVASLAYVLNITSDSNGGISGIEVVGEAKAVMGTHRRTRRRSLAVGYTAGAASAEAQEQQASNASQPAPAPEYGPLPEGTVISVLPDGCVPVTSGSVQYQHCGENYFRTAFQGDNLVYVSSSIK